MESLVQQLRSGDIEAGEFMKKMMEAVSGQRNSSNGVSTVSV